MGLIDFLKGVITFGAASGGGEADVAASVSIPIGGAHQQAQDGPSEAVSDRGWSKSLEDCHQRLRDAYQQVKDEFERAHPGMTLKLDYTYRSPAFQFELYKKGRKKMGGAWVVVDKSQVVTDKDGTKPSHHNVWPSQALDHYVVENGSIMWPNPDDERVCRLYSELGAIWNRAGLISGATWKYGWHDWDHVQVDYPIL